jgi:hypothetical protein
MADHESETSTDFASLLQETLDGLAGFCRDTTLAPEILAHYQRGLVFREPTFCDASYKIAGFAAPHRYLIFSANARCVDELSQHPEWGLCLWMPRACFKVIDRLERGGHTQITLLEIPEPLLPLFATGGLEQLEDDLAQEAHKLFEQAMQQAPLPELSTRLWLDRLEMPLGLNDQCAYFELLSLPVSPTQH